MKKTRTTEIILTSLVVLVGWCVIAVASPTPAQGKRARLSPSERVEMRVQHYTQHLGLTTDQQTQFRSILQDEMNQRQALHGDRSVSPADRRARAQQIHDASLAKLRETLNPEQQRRFDKIQARQKSPRE